MDEWAFLDELNMSELTEMAQAQNVNAHRGLPRDVLISIIQGDEVELPLRRIDIWRRTIFAFVDSHWKQCSPLLNCPLQTRQPHACFNCPDIQVADCMLMNHQTLVNTVNRMNRKD